LFFLIIILIIGRLFYWQIVASDTLYSLGEQQHFSTINIPAKRGEIRTSDNYPIVTNKEAFLIYAYLPQLQNSPSETASRIAPILQSYFSETDASPSGNVVKRPQKVEVKELIEEKLARNDVAWIPIVRDAKATDKKKVESLDLEGIGTESSFIRDYPEASMAASLIGFVGNDRVGDSKGYFGIEGYYDLELKGRSGVLRQERDASGKPILIGQFEKLDPQEGRHLVLHINRVVQRIAENKLQEGLRKYGAKSGEVIIVNPKSGAVIAMASLPSYNPSQYNKYDESLFRNPAVSEFYEPGSTFKVITMASALDARAVKPDTHCDICDKPLRIGRYLIRTWDDKYHANSTMKEVIQNSDNIGMVYAVSKLGKEKLIDYLERFGIGEKSGIDLEEEASPKIRGEKEWKEIDLATAAFGQGIAVTGIQMVRAVSAIANRGVMFEPKIVDRVIGKKTLEVNQGKTRKVISKDTAGKMTEMMVNAVEKGEAKWAKPKGYKIAGKTGTSQIPVAGHYDEEKTIASFIGFAPADDPKFVMLTKLREPETSPWGSETAAPLWFSIAKDLLFYYDVQPE
jgi:cell division protein FtsI/penicillin-binding protein 2